MLMNNKERIKGFLQEFKTLFTANYIFNLILVMMMGLVHAYTLEIIKMYIYLSGLMQEVIQMIIDLRAYGLTEEEIKEIEAVNEYENNNTETDAINRYCD